MKNYYDELEVNKNASKEVIEKVYKVLAKKYHPDSTKEIDKQAAEEKFKIISEAYDVLSDESKRKKYDIELETSNPTVSYSEYLTVLKQRDTLNLELNKLKNSTFSTQYSQKTYNNSNVNSNTINNTSSTKNTQSYNTNQSYQQKKTYSTNTKKTYSTIDHLKHKIKEFFTNITLFILSLILAISIFSIFSNLNLFNLFFK